MAIIIQLVGILLVALVVGIYWGPWIALTRSLASFPLELFLAVVRQLNANLGGLMTALVPLSLLAQIALVVVAFMAGTAQFTLAAVAFALFIITVIVTMTTEVPIVKRVVTWTVETAPTDWEAQRDRWMRFHLLRVIPGLAALLLYVAAAIL